MGFLTRVKKLTDYTYSPTNPTSEDAIRLQIDDASQEVYDNVKNALTSVTDGDSGLDLIGMTPINGVMTTPQQSLEYLKTRVDSILPTMNFVSVSDYGAVGDGVTDDKAAIQSAVDASTPGSTIFFPSGNYLIKGFYNPWVNNSRLTDGVVLKSDITLVGDINTIITQDENCNFTFTTALRRDVIGYNDNLNNITIKNLKFVKTNPIFRQFSHLINIESINNLIIENCSFYGWSGDAIAVGWVTYDDLSTWYKSHVEDVVIRDCYFDGVNKDNRQGISLMHGIRCLIENCYFTRTTRGDLSDYAMPGAIDIEPDFDWCTVKDITIDKCNFYDIGGSVAVVGFALTRPLLKRPENLSVTNCNFDDTENTFIIAFRGPENGVSQDIYPLSPRNIIFSGNKISNAIRLFRITGCENVMFSENIINNTIKQSLFGEVLENKNANCKNIWVENNKIQNCHIDASGDPYRSFINVVTSVDGLSLKSNSFLNVGNDISGVPNNMAIINFETAARVGSKNVFISENDLINNVFSTNSAGFYCSGALTNPDSFFVYNNKFKNINISFAESLYIRSSGNVVEKNIVAINSTTVNDISNYGYRKSIRTEVTTNVTINSNSIADFQAKILLMYTTAYVGVPTLYAEWIIGKNGGITVIDVLNAGVTDNTVSTFTISVVGNDIVISKTGKAPTGAGVLSLHITANTKSITII